jgi:HNH endonuclease
MVEYRDVLGAPGYRVGSDGSVWSRRNNRWGLNDAWRPLAPRKLVAKGRREYARWMVMLGRGRPKYVHHLVLEAFVGPCPPGHEACHINGDSLDCALSNLKWGTREENMTHMRQHGRKKGERHHRPSLTDDMVRRIRTRAAAGESSYLIARDFPVGDRAIRKVIQGTRWSHVQ